MSEPTELEPEAVLNASDDPNEALRLPDGGSTRRDGESPEDVGEGYPQGWEMDLSTDEADGDERANEARTGAASDASTEDGPADAADTAPR